VRAIIAGAGIGGLATALALSRAGLEVTLYERSRALQEFGAGLQLAPNATRILSALGVLESVRIAAMQPKSLSVHRGSDDQLLARMPVGDAERRWGAPYLTIHRADLQRILVQAALRRSNLRLELDSTVVDIAANDERLTIGLIRGSTPVEDHADLLIGADGLHSRVREHFRLGDADNPAFTGHVALRAIAEGSGVDSRWLQNEMRLFLGPSAHLILYPLRFGSALNIVAVIQSNRNAFSEDPPWEGRVDSSALGRGFAGWSRATRKLLAAASSWGAWPILVRPPIAFFSRGAVALVGDAAHPMTPFLAQGAGQAIEDAGALAQVFHRPRSVPDALHAYSRMRVARATRVQLAAQRQGPLYHSTGPTAFVRDAAMGVLGAERLRRRYDWLFAD
jgi:salicylate hydroxylase